jgi:integrase/recombinase XerD
MNWDEALLAFAEQTRQRLRPRTIKMALGQVKRFIAFCPDLSGPSQVQPGHLVAFLESEVRRATVRAAWHNITDLKCFFRWANRARVIHWNPAADLKPPQFPSTRLPLSYAQVQTLLKLPEPQSRDATILEVFYGTGLRMGEAFGLDVSDVDLSGLCLHLRNTKGGQSRLTPIGDHLAEVLRHYLEHVRPRLLKDVAEPALWLSAQGQGTRLSQAQLTWVVAKFFRQAGLVGASAHSLRHSYATHLLDGGAPLLVVQALLGHRSLLSTKTYTHILQLEMLREYRRFHPRARRKRRRKS